MNKTALLLAAGFFALILCLLLFQSSATMNDKQLTNGLENLGNREVHPNDSDLVTLPLARSSIDFFGQVQLNTWPNYKPLPSATLLILDSNGEERVQSTDANGIAKYPIGKWDLPSKQNEFAIAGELGLDITPNSFQTCTAFIQATFAFQILNMDGRPQQDLRLIWLPHAPYDFIESQQVRTDALGNANILSYVVPGKISIFHGPKLLRDFDFTTGLPPESLIRLFVQSELEPLSTIEIRDKESNAAVVAAKIHFHHEVRTSDENGIAHIPTRWGDEYPLFFVEATGYSGITQRLTKGIPRVILLNKSAGLRVRVLDSREKPVPDAIVRPFPDVGQVTPGANIRKYLPAALLTDINGECLLEIEQGRAIQVFVTHPEFGFGHAFESNVTFNSTISIQLKQEQPLRLSFKDRGGNRVPLRKVALKCRGIDKRWMPRDYSISKAAYSIPNPSFLDVIQIHPSGYLPILLRRQSFKTGVLPYSVANTGGDLEITLDPTHIVKGTIVDENGFPQKRQRFQLQELLGNRKGANSHWDNKWIFPHSAWFGVAACFSPEIRTNSKGGFHLNLPGGTWVAANAESLYDLPLGSGGQTDSPFVIPQSGALQITVPGKKSLHLTVLDESNGLPIPKFVIRLKEDPLTNGSLGFKAGAFGRWDGWVRTTALENIEIAATGYQVQSLNLTREKGMHSIHMTLRLIAETPGAITFIGEEAKHLIYETFRIVDVGDRGMGMFGESRWEYTFQLPPSLEVLFPAPSSRGKFSIVPATLGSRSVRFAPSVFQYSPGERVTIQVLPSSD